MEQHLAVAPQQRPSRPAARESVASLVALEERPIVKRYAAPQLSVRQHQASGSPMTKPTHTDIPLGTEQHLCELAFSSTQGWRTHQHYSHSSQPTKLTASSLPAVTALQNAMPDPEYSDGAAASAELASSEGAEEGGQAPKSKRLLGGLKPAGRTRPTNNQLLYKAYFRWSHYPHKLLEGPTLPLETEACASVTSAFLQVLSVLYNVETGRLSEPRNILQLLSINTRRTKVVELSSGTHRVPDELRRHSLSDGKGGQYSTNLDRNRYGTDDQYLSTVIRYDLDFLDMCPCLVDVEIIDAKNGSGTVLVSADEGLCTCGGKPSQKQLKSHKAERVENAARASSASGGWNQRGAAASGESGLSSRAEQEALGAQAGSAGNDLFDALLMAATVDAAPAAAARSAGEPATSGRAHLTTTRQRSRIWALNASAAESGDQQRLAEEEAGSGHLGTESVLRRAQVTKHVRPRSTLARRASTQSVRETSIMGMPLPKSNGSAFAPLPGDSRAGGLADLCSQEVAGNGHSEGLPASNAAIGSRPGAFRVVQRTGSAGQLSSLGRASDDAELRRLQQEVSQMKVEAASWQSQLAELSAKEAAARSQAGALQDELNLQQIHVAQYVAQITALKAEVQRLGAAHREADARAVAQQAAAERAQQELATLKSSHTAHPAADAGSRPASATASLTEHALTEDGQPGHSTASAATVEAKAEAMWQMPIKVPADGEPAPASTAPCLPALAPPAATSLPAPHQPYPDTPSRLGGPSLKPEASLSDLHEQPWPMSSSHMDSFMLNGLRDCGAPEWFHKSPSPMSGTTETATPTLFGGLAGLLTSQELQPTAHPAGSMPQPASVCQTLSPLPASSGVDAASKTVSPASASGDAPTALVSNGLVSSASQTESWAAAQAQRPCSASLSGPAGPAVPAVPSQQNGPIQAAPAATASASHPAPAMNSSGQYPSTQLPPLSTTTMSLPVPSAGPMFVAPPAVADIGGPAASAALPTPAASIALHQLSQRQDASICCASAPANGPSLPVNGTIPAASGIAQPANGTAAPVAVARHVTGTKRSFDQANGVRLHAAPVPARPLQIKDSVLSVYSMPTAMDLQQQRPDSGAATASAGLLPPAKRPAVGSTAASQSGPFNGPASEPDGSCAVSWELAPTQSLVSHVEVPWELGADLLCPPGPTVQAWNAMTATPSTS